MFVAADSVWCGGVEGRKQGKETSCREGNEGLGRGRGAQVSTICQITVLEPVSGGPGEQAQADGGLCVVNTHLFFHPNAPHIRTIHTAAMLAEADRLLQEVGPGPQGARPALLFCGDLNSDLNDGVPGMI